MFVKSYTSNILKIWIISKRHLQNNLKMVLVWIINSGMYLWKPDLTYIFKAEKAIFKLVGHSWPLNNTILAIICSTVLDKGIRRNKTT